MVRDIVMVTTPRVVRDWVRVWLNESYVSKANRNVDNADQKSAEEHQRDRGHGRKEHSRLRRRRSTAEKDSKRLGDLEYNERQDVT